MVLRRRRDAVGRIFGFAASCSGVNNLRRLFSFSAAKVDEGNRRHGGQRAEIPTELRDIAAARDAEIYTAVSLSLTPSRDRRLVTRRAR